MARKDRNKVSDETQSEPTPEVEVPEANQTETGTKANDQNKPKKEKAPLPEGYVTPVSFAKLLGERVGKEIRPQVIYGYIRNTKAFREQAASQNVDQAWMINTEAGFAWWDEKEARKAKSAADKEAKAQAAAEKASEPAPAE